MYEATEYMTLVINQLAEDLKDAQQEKDSTSNPTDEAYWDGRIAGLMRAVDVLKATPFKVPFRNRESTTELKNVAREAMKKQMKESK